MIDALLHKAARLLARLSTERRARRLYRVKVRQANLCREAARLEIETMETAA
jgi:hypothetical protein